ncbi:MAG: hypothetical protein ACI4KH_03915 [Oscillospiraceae bacterium]
MIDVKIVTENEFSDFLKLPSMLYEKKRCVQKISEEEALLKGTHTLSGYFSFTGFVCFKDGVLSARCAVTLYPEKDFAYIGFFECTDDEDVAFALIKSAEEFAKKNGRKKLIGPVDASFWISYRMKADRFDKLPYLSEPYCKEYYPRLWEKCGFAVSERYISNIYEKFSSDEKNIKKYINRYNAFLKKGYKIISPKKSQWDKVIKEVYALIIKLYSDFPVFSYITEEEFCTLFSSFKLILDFSMVKIAYFNGEAVGFFIGAPDYKNRLYNKIGFAELLFLLKNRTKCDNYIMLYVGVDDKHKGLGTAMTQAVFDNMRKKQATAVGAFIKEGKVTARYVGEKISGQYHYLLFEKEI